MFLYVLIILSVLCLCSCQATSEPPMARIVPKELVKHGHVRTDDYYWLNQREDPEVIAYLEAENAYADQRMSHTKELQDQLFEEIKGRIKKDDSSVPYKENGYFYYSRNEKGKEYDLLCRKKGSLDGEEEIMLDINEMAKGHEFFSVSGRKVSPDGKMIAFGVDTRGRRIYTLHFKDLETGRILEDEIKEVTGNVAWANDNQTIFYTKKEKVTLRSYQIWRHTLGEDPAKDQLVYEESDDTFTTHLEKTKSKRFILIVSDHTLSSEVRFLDADHPMGEFKVFSPRERDHEYSVEHFEDHFYIRTNLKAKNFRLMKTPMGQLAKQNWIEVIPNRDEVYFQGMEIFKDYLVLSERKAGLKQIRIMPWKGDGDYYLDFGEAAYSAYVGKNPEFDTKLLRYSYSSLTTPRSTYDFNMETREKTLLKQDEVVGDFDSNNYQVERICAKAGDGVKIPISLVYRKGIKKDGTNPLLLYGYGSYGASMDAGFKSAALSLLDRGFIYAIAHIRGGQEMGRDWYENGKLFKKKNTFLDFISCGEHLVQEKYAGKDLLFAQGGSAGGLLIGAVTNMAPDLFSGVVAQVPFVDVITTMLDPSIPLTTGEYDEWGDPNKKEYYHYILSYSPYDNVEKKAYPHILVTTGLHDSQVQYWEPAKWVAKLRTHKTDNNLLLLKTNMDAGHGGASGRFKRLKNVALVYAFLLDMAGK